MKSCSHATPAKIFSEAKNIPSRPGRPLREPFPISHAQSATFVKVRSDLKNKPSRPLRPWRESSAFSLTEVVIAMGVAAVAFTSIIGLFPLGLNMSKESYESVQASLLAQTIMADLKDQQTGTTNLRTAGTGFKNYQIKLLQIGANSDPVNTSSNHIMLPLNSLSPVITYVAYDQAPRTNSDTDPLQTAMLRPCAYSTNSSPPSWYTSGSNGLFAAVKITISPSCRFGSASSTSTPMRIDVSVETPGSANITNRTCYLFTGLARP